MNLEQQVKNAGPHELVLMLYDGCINFIDKGEEALVNKDYETSNNFLQRAENILTELTINLDMKYDISKQLSSLYCYAYDRLVEGNLFSKTSLIEEAKKIVSELRDAWIQAINKVTPEEIEAFA